MRSLAVVLIAVVLLPLGAAAQFRLPDIGPLPGPDIPLKIPGLDRLFKEDPPLTTSLEDARFGVPFLDEFEPYFLTKMTHLPRGPNGDFLLVRPGVYQLNFESYCLHAGAYGPGKGEGYLWAPLKGARADVILSVLHGSFRHPDIPQEEIQALIWAILARTKVSDMPGDLRGVARLLLTKKEISRLNGGAVGQIPPQLYDRVFGDVPAPLRRVYEAEAGLRSMFARGVSDFGALERVAVLAGDPPETEDGPETPRGRWSYHPDGYFIRYFPSSYSKTRVQVSVPEPFRVERDERGRIAVVADGYGNRIETAYDDTVQPLEIAGDTSVRGYAFRSVRFIRRVVIPPEMSIDLEAEWDNVGMTLVGVPAGEGLVQEPAEGLAGAVERYDWGCAHKADVERLVEAVSVHRGAGASDEGFDDIIDLGHYAAGLRAVLGEAENVDEWATHQLELVETAWQRAICHYFGTETEPAPVAVGQVDGGSLRLASLGLSPLMLAGHARLGANGERAFGPGSGGAQPGDPRHQRLATGDEDPETDKPNDPDIEAVKREKEVQETIRDAFKDTDPEGHADSDAYRDAVRQEAEKRLREKGLLGSGKKTHSPMATRCSDGRLVPGGYRSESEYAEDWRQWDMRRGWDWDIEWVKPTHFGGKPDILYEAARAHERVHEETWERLKREGKDPCDWFEDPENYQQDDVKAYNKQIDMLDEWIKHDC